MKPQCYLATRTFKHHACLLWLLAAVSLAPLRAQNAPVSAQQAATLAPDDFDVWAKNQSNRTRLNGEEPVALEQATLERLRGGLAVSDEAILHTARSWVRKEGSVIAKRIMNAPGIPTTGADFTNVQRLTSELLPMVVGRP